MGDLHLLNKTLAVMARSPSGKAEDCKSSIVGSIPTRASIFNPPLTNGLGGFFVFRPQRRIQNWTGEQQCSLFYALGEQTCFR